MPVTSPVSLTKIKNEFNGTNSFSAYVRGGSYVPNIPALSGISATTNGLAMSQFLNASNISVSLPGWNAGFGYDNVIGSSYVDNICNGAYAEVYLYVNSNGTMVYNDMLNNYNHTWLQNGTASDIYFRFDVTSGTNPSLSTAPGYGNAAIGTNLQMNTNYWFRISSTANCGEVTQTDCYGTWSFRDASNNVLASQTFWMSAYTSSA